MKTIRLLVFACAIALAGCSTVPGQRLAVTPEQGAAAVRIAVATTGTLALARNPNYVETARALAAGIDGAIAADVTITPEGIASFVRAICAKRNLPPGDVAVFITLATSAYSFYVTQYKQAVVRSTDPTVLLYVSAFKLGLADAVLAVSPPTTP